MWSKWSLRAKIMTVAMGVVLPIMAATTALTVRLSRQALEDDIRTNGLTLARELATSVASRRGPAGGPVLQHEIGSLLGRGGVVRDVAVYAVGPHGLLLRAADGTPHQVLPQDEIAARENQEVVVLRTEGRTRLWHVAVPVREEGRSVGVVSLGLPLDRVDALAKREEREAVGLSVISVVLIVGSLSTLLNRALTAPVRALVQVMLRAEGGDLATRAPQDRQDEVGQIARGLNRMLEKVHSFQGELTRQVADATAQLRSVNQRLYAAQQQVARNERLAAAGELAAAMAHDVGTPLTAVSGHLQLLEEEVPDPRVKERLRLIQGHVDRVVAAARRFLDAARPEPSRVPVDLNALLEDLLVLTSPEAQRKGIGVSRRLDQGIAPVPADPAQMQELFLNLITNALETMEDGGVLTVITEVLREDGGLPGIRVILGDTGPGIPPEVSERAFEPFFTTKTSQRGTGLGLAICRRIARDHGGSIRLESSPGQGTRAVVELPARDG